MEQTDEDVRGLWIPGEVWRDARLSPLEKIILARVLSLDNGEDGCWAGNAFIAESCQCTKPTVSAAINKLVCYGYLNVKKFNGRVRILKGSLREIGRQSSENPKADFGNPEQSNTKSNTMSNTKSNKQERRADSFDGMLKSYTQDEETLALLGEWLRVRKAKRAAMTDKSIKLNLEKLDGIAAASGMSVKTYLGEAVRRGWCAFYEIHEQKNRGGARPVQPAFPQEDDLSDLF